MGGRISQPMERAGPLRELWRHLSRRRRIQIVLVVGLTIVAAFAEVISLGVVLPFIGVLVSPERVLHQPFVARAAPIFGITTAAQLALALTVALAIAAILAAIVRLAVLWASTRLSFAIGIDISIDMYRRTLYQPYSVHVERNSSEVVAGIAQKTSTVVIGIVLPALTLISSLVLLVSIVLTLLAIDPIIASVSAVGFSASYGLISWVSRRKLQSNGRRIAVEQTQLFKTLQEGLGGIRDVLLDGTQPYYCQLYHRADASLRNAQASNTFISASPRYAMEGLGVILLAGIAYWISASRGGIASSLPVLGALALGAQRLIPAMQQVFASWSSIVGSHASLVDALVLLDQPLPLSASQPAPERLPFHEAIEFDAVRFHYHANGPWVLDGLDLRVARGARVGIVGSTGSGKTTTVDLLMGLLSPTEGRLCVDGEPLTDDVIRSWQRNIAHVPQTVYLADAPVAENIAFGVPVGSIDMTRVKAAARQAQIAGFVESQPEGYRAFVGERGVRLSGGQRQRIGIARALYKEATVLVFDEATSALDRLTEQAVMDAIDGLDRDLTIFIIAHRLTTVERCDVIVELERGRIVAQGTYRELLNRSASFRAMASSSRA